MVFKDLTPEEVLNLIEENNENMLMEYLEEQHPADIAELLEKIPDEKRLYIFNSLPPDKAVLVLEELDYDLRFYILNNLPYKYMTHLLKEMSADEITDFLGELPAEFSQKWLDLLEIREREDIRNLLKYEENTAGGLMTLEYIAFPFGYKIRDVLEKLPEMAPDAETIYYIYVTDKEKHLKGVVSLRDLILADPELTLEDVMLTDVKKVDANMDQEDVAKVFEKYGFLGLPVVDDKNILLGIITVDDVMDVLEEEATEDILKLAGTDSQRDIEGISPWYRACRRLPWLLVALFGQIISGAVISGFSKALEAVVALSFFIPVLMDMGGNVGTQSSAVVVRGIATNRINVRELWENIIREGFIGLILGSICGIIAALIVYLWQGIPALGLVVGISMTLTLTVAAVLGTFVPLTLNKLGKDPAVSSGPFVTTMLDIISLTVYFSSASLFIGYILQS